MSAPGRTLCVNRAQGSGLREEFDMASAHEESFNAIQVAIKERAEAVGDSNLNEAAKASALRDLAAAWRHLRGGAQPGGISVEK